MLRDREPRTCRCATLGNLDSLDESKLQAQTRRLVPFQSLLGPHGALRSCWQRRKRLLSLACPVSVSCCAFFVPRQRQLHETGKVTAVTVGSPDPAGSKDRLGHRCDIIGDFVDGKRRAIEEGFIRPPQAQQIDNRAYLRCIHTCTSRGCPSHHVYWVFGAPTSRRFPSLSSAGDVVTDVPPKPRELVKKRKSFCKPPVRAYSANPIDEYRAFE